MNSKLLFPLLFLIIGLALGCKKEPAIQPDTIRPEYHLPQGNHPYDKKILDFHEKYGTYVLYKFTDKDFQWNITTNLLYAADPGDEGYIEQSLEMLDKKLFSFYTEGFLKLSLPYKILLSSRIREIKGPDTVATPVNTVSTFSQFTFGQASPRIDHLTEEQLKTLKGDLHVAYWKQAVVTKKVELPDIFVAATDYGAVQDYNKDQYGVFKYSFGMGAKEDLMDYINAIVTHTAAELEATIFLPKNDPQGRFRFKYNAIINYYKTKYNVDLQAIGNSK